MLYAVRRTEKEGWVAAVFPRLWRASAYGRQTAWWGSSKGLFPVVSVSKTWPNRRGQLPTEAAGWVAAVFPRLWRASAYGRQTAWWGFPRGIASSPTGPRNDGLFQRVARPAHLRRVHPPWADLLVRPDPPPGQFRNTQRHSRGTMIHRSAGHPRRARINFAPVISQGSNV